MNRFIKIVVCVVLVIVVYFILNPLVLDYSDSSLNFVENKYKQGDEFSLNDLLYSVNKSNYKLYIILKEEDENVINSKKIKNCILFSSDVNLITNLLKEKFVYTERDVSTIESKIILCSEGEVIFKSAILISEDKVGIQNRLTGWSELNNSKSFNIMLEQLDCYNYPILIFK